MGAPRDRRRTHSIGGNTRQQHKSEEATPETSFAPAGDRKSESAVPTKIPVKSSARRGTGPRTLAGKQRSKHNATKHGIFSGVVVLKGESKAEYESLLDGFWEALGPEGGLEELLVEKLATISWRHRRLLVAEGAEIRRNTEFVEWDQQNEEQEEATKLGTIPSFTLVEAAGDADGGLIEKIGNPNVLDYCLELLRELRGSMQTDGIRKWRDSEFRKIYGRKRRLCPTLYDRCTVWFDIMEVPEEQRKRSGYTTPDQCRQIIVDDMDAEIRRLKEYQKTRASIESDRTKLEILRRSVPDSPGLDRLLRYEASLERSFDRTLNQLERLQRIRLGQPVTPRIDVNFSA